jgi:two-component system, NtrC family, sensor histidine kinase KinB
LPAGDLAAAIYEIGLRASLSGELEQVIQPIVRAVLRATDSFFAGIAVTTATGDGVVHTWGTTSDATEYPEGRIQRLNEGIVGQAAASGRAVVVNDTSLYPAYVPLVPDVRSEAALPLKLGDRLIGVLDVESKLAGHFDAAKVALLEAIAAPIARSIETARLFRETRRRLDQLALLNHVSRIITSTVDLEELLKRTVSAIRQELGYGIVALGLVDRGTSRVVLRAADANCPTDLPIGFALPLGVGITGSVVRAGRSVLVADVRQRADYVSAAAAIRCEMCSPLKSRSGIIGFLDAATTEVGGFDQHDLMLLDTLADHISQAIENAWTLQRLQGLRDELSGMVIHDLRNPLTVVMSALDMLQQLQARQLGAKDPALAARAAQASERLHREGQAACEEMMVLIGSLLDLQKLESGQLELSADPCSPADLVRSVASKMTLVADSRHIKLETRVGEGLPAVRLDMALLGRVVENLIINALKFTPAGGTVTVEVEAAAHDAMRAHAMTAGGAVLLRVRDTGPGIAPADRERIFEKFGLAESRRAQNKPSTGLGLAFCKRAVQLHGGTIWVADNAPAGSAFCILLPA